MVVKEVDEEPLVQRPLPSESVFFEFDAPMAASDKMQPSEFFALNPDDALARFWPHVQGGFYLAAAASLPGGLLCWRMS